jgi:hypothetical protein
MFNGKGLNDIVLGEMVAVYSEKKKKRKDFFEQP